MAKLSVIVLSWNTKELLERCLESVMKGIGDVGEIEVIVVDNASVDGSVEMVKSEFPKVKLIRNRKNLGFAKGNNLGLKVAKGEYLMLLNSDTIVKEGALTALVTYLEEHQGDELALSPLLELPNGQPQTDYYMRFPNFWQIFLYHHPLLRPLIMRTPFLKLLIAQRAKKKPFLVEQLPGTALVASKKVWQKVGELDADFHFFFEDVDWCWRARQKKVWLMVIPEAEVVHLGGASWKQRIKENAAQFYYQFFASWLLFVRKHYGRGWEKIYRWAIVANFLLTLKPVLAFQFWKNGGKQLSFWR
jgi:hypothetical protein